MIYTKDAIFPYPILRYGSNDYQDNGFNLKIKLEEDTFNYYFKVTHELESEFINDLVANDLAETILVIQSKDNKFFTIKQDEETVAIKKSRLSLDTRTSLQLLIRAKSDVSFELNSDLDPYYDDIKEQIVIHPYAVLAISNVVIYDGRITKPFELFEKRLDPDLASEISIELGQETIIINYKNELLQFAEFPKATELNYPYVYMGLQRALNNMITELSDDTEALYIEEMAIPENILMFKLYSLLKSKHVEELNMDNIDEVIDRISDRMMSRFYATVKEISINAG